MKSLDPEAGRKGGLDQEGANDVVRGAKHALSLAVLSGSVRARHAQLNTVRKEEEARRRVIELPPVVALDSLDGAPKLSRNPSEEMRNRGKSRRLGAQGKSPGVMRKIINHHKVILITRNTENRRGP